MALGVPCKHCRRLEVSHQYKRQPTGDPQPAINGACENYEPISRFEQVLQEHLKHDRRYKWCEVL
jgi:hypothetical protein